MKKLYLLLTLAVVTIFGNVVAMKKNKVNINKETIGEKIIKNFKADVAELLYHTGTNNAIDGSNKVDLRFVKGLINKALLDSKYTSELRSYIENLSQLRRFCCGIFLLALELETESIPLDSKKCCTIQ
jgi:hypothetical protein